MPISKQAKFKFLVTLIFSIAVAFAAGFACGTEAMKNYVLATLQ